MDYERIKAEDPDAYAAIKGEAEREADGLELIPSENYVSRAVREAQGSVFTNKYSEGYPGRRYYGGQEFTDAIETLAIERAKALFGAAFANVQPHSGSNANLAAYLALLAPGDTVLGMDLSHGGHLTHGAPVTAAASFYRFVRYRMQDPDTGAIDYDALRQLALAERPKILLAGFSAYPRALDYERLATIAHEAGALAVMDAAHIAGLIAGHALPNPLDAGFDVMTATTHKTLRGPRGGLILTRDDAQIAKRIDKALFPGLQGGPLMHAIAGKAVAFREAAEPSFRAYAAQVLANAKAMERVFRARGVRLIGGGTDNHLLLADVMGSLGVSGKEAEALLDAAGLTVNKNVIADDPRPPLDPSGIRFGTPAISTRGFDEEGSARVAELMLDALAAKDDPAAQAAVRDEVRALANAHPIPDSFF
ncbi:MAG TPA: serine hydroxymethyltransferase [Candidatus Paceibacterota bacterium]|nr:serine hydroxymethyltransferase [Candidatus Paceibacterota bacterium]